MRAQVITTLALVLLGALALPEPLRAQEVPGPEEEPPGPEVVELRFEGAHTLTRAQLEGAIVTEATHCKSPLYFLFCALGMGWSLERAYLDPEEVPADVERLQLFYEAWGFPDAVVGSRVVPRDGDRVEVVFEIMEGEPIRVAELTIVGLETLAPPVELEEPLPIGPGDLYALPLLAELEGRIRFAFAERGHPYAVIEAEGSVDEVARLASVVLRVEPGPLVFFGEPILEPEPPIRESTVSERLAFRPGDLFSPSALRETERLLYRLPIVEEVQIEPLGLDRGDTLVTPRIVVEPGRRRAIYVEGSVSSSRCLEVAVFGADRYFGGGPRLLGVGVGFSNLLASTVGGFPCTSTGSGDYADPNYFVELELRQPWRGSPRTMVQARGFYRRESVPQVYIQRGYGGQLGITRELRPELIGSLIYSPARNELRSAELYFCGNFGICGESAIDSLTSPHWLAPVDLSISWSPDGGPLALRRLPGERWRRWVNTGISGATVVTGSEYDFLRGSGEGAVTRIFGDRWELAFRTRLGGLLGEHLLPPQTRLFSGGANSVRGVSQNLLGPKVLVTRPGQVEELGCLLEPGGCPAGLVVDPDLVGVRALGGRGVVEANLEGRLWVGEAVQFVGFVDFGSLWRNPFSSTSDSPGGPSSESLITPGLGLRVVSPFGPIRLDLGYDPTGTHHYPLLVRDPELDELVLLGEVGYNPYTYGRPGWLKEFWRRLQLQIAIGQPF